MKHWRHLKVKFEKNLKLFIFRFLFNKMNYNISNIVDHTNGEIGNTVDIIITREPKQRTTEDSIYDGLRKVLNLNFNILKKIKYINLYFVDAPNFTQKIDYSDEMFNFNYERTQVIVSNNTPENISKNFTKMGAGYESGAEIFKIVSFIIDSSLKVQRITVVLTIINIFLTHAQS